MTAKDKAIELFKGFFKLIATDDVYEDLYCQTAKQCSLIAVDEMLNYEFDSNNESQDRLVSRYEYYWQEVKAEIEKL